MLTILIMALEIDETTKKKHKITCIKVTQIGPMDNFDYFCIGCYAKTSAQFYKRGTAQRFGKK